MKPIEFLEFDGGLTDKDVPGKTNRASIIDNLLIDYDKKLLQRDGFDILSSTAYQLVAGERVARLANFDVDSEILAFQNKKAFAIAAGAWVEVQGPGGGSSAQHAFNTNTAASLVEESQWQHHLFAASDSGDPVIKMYRDSGAVMRLRTAGLPEFPTSSDSTAASYAITPSDGGLALSIALANDLRSKMITHYGANGATAGAPNNLSNGHHSAHADLAAQAAAVTASTSATTLASLIILLNILRTQYNAHMIDAQKEDPFAIGPTPPKFREYHAAPASGGEPFYIYYDPVTTVNQPAFQWRHYLNFSIEDTNYTLPYAAAIADLLAYVNDLRDKWNWHTYATNTHFNAMKWKGAINTHFGTHASALANVSVYSWAQITPNYGPFLQYVKDLYSEYNVHIASTDMHMPIVDSTNVVDASFPTTPATFWDAVCLLGGLADAFTFHAMEADPDFGYGRSASDWQTGVATMSSGTKTMSWASGGTADQFKFYNIVPIIGASGALPVGWLRSTGNSGASTIAFMLHANYKITGSTAATPTVLTVPTNFSASASAFHFLLTTAQYHLGTHGSTLFIPRDFAKTFDNLDFTLKSASSLQGFADIAKTLASYMKIHTLSKMAVGSGSLILSNLKLNNNNFDAYYQNEFGLQSLGEKAYTHITADDVNYPIITTFPQSPMFTTVTWEQERFTVAPTAASFLYKTVFRYDYTIGTKKFSDFSAPSEPINAIGFINEDSGGSTETGKYAAALANLYVFANATNENFAHTDTTNFRKEIYRTLGNGTRYYKVDVNNTGGDMTNATTSFSDYSSDTYLVDQLELYTNGGTPENNRPPVASGIHVFGNVMLYVVGNKVYQSIPNDLDSVPSDFFEEFEENVVAVSSTRSVAVAFTSTKVSRLTGGIDDLGRGSLGHDVIFDRTGAISAPSIVKADNGIFFAGKDGFYFTDGYQCMRVTDLEKTFRTYTNTAAKRNSIQGTYDNISKRVYWTVTTTGGSAPDRIWVLDLQFGIKPDATPVTTLSKTSGFNPTALTFFNGQIYYGDGDGYVFAQTRGLSMDLVKNTGVAATSWDKEATQWDFKSCHYNYGTEAARKYFTRAGARFDMQATNVSCQIVSDADKGRITSNLPIIRSRKLTDWGDSKIDWVSSVYPAKSGNMVDEWRMFKADGSLRSNFRAVELKTAYCVIVASKDMGTVTIANVAGNVYTVTLTSLVATRKWPLYSVGYFVRINAVDYPVTVRTSDSVIRIDSTGFATPSTGVPASWELWGYPKNEKIRLIGYGVSVELEDEQQTHSDGPVLTGGQNG